MHVGHAIRRRVAGAPIEARPDREAGLIFVVTDVDSAKEDEIEAASDVCLVFIDPNDKAYLSITARADVMRDDLTEVVKAALNRRRKSKPSTNEAG